MKDVWSESKSIVSQMTLEEKASLCSGKDFWNLKGIERLGLPSIMITDGPHGLRKQMGEADNLGINESAPATCFPPACTTACSFDEELAKEIGEALGEECRQEGISVLLGPGANIKRSPLCGRNFEYFSEDPYLTGQMSAAMITGMQSKGVGASIKHFAANNQEQYRMTSNSVVDERALREIYMRAFEIAVKKSQPWTVMCSYNRVNGTYASENQWLLGDVLRDEWGFEGAVVSDWGATNKRVKALAAGMEIEMPYSGRYHDRKIVEAVKTGKLEEAVLNRAVERIVALILKSKPDVLGQAAYSDAGKTRHLLAKKAASASTVLLKNEDAILPCKRASSMAVIGAFAKIPRYQGAGSSKINPTCLETAHDALFAMGVQFDYAEGYSLNATEVEEALIQEACETAKGKDVVVLFAGLPEVYESEGYDRGHLNLPDSHNKLIEAVCDVNDNVVVVMQLGAPVMLPWRNKVKGILLAYLGGQAGGGSLADIIVGNVNPSGKLAETWPLCLEDTPCYNYFPGDSNGVEYRESIFVGYRYYEKAQKAVAYPFGYGLSYTSFAYSSLGIDTKSLEKSGNIHVSCTVTNTGARAGAEVVQCYVGMAHSRIPRAQKELRGFKKVFLQPGESKKVSVAIDERFASYYNVKTASWCVEEGEYTISLGSSSQDIRLSGSVQMCGDQNEALLDYLEKETPSYFDLPKGEFIIKDREFESVYGKPLPAFYIGKKRFTANSTLMDIRETWLGRFINKLFDKHAPKFMGKTRDDLKNMMELSFQELPLRTFCLCSNGAFTMPQLDGLVHMLNGRFFKGLYGLLIGINKETFTFIKKYL